jgi:hypothetical protein
VPNLNFTKVQEYLIKLVPPREPEMVIMEKYAARTGFPIIELSLVISIFSLFWFFKVIRYEPSLQRDKLVFL